MIFFSYALYVLYDMWPRRRFDMCVYNAQKQKTVFVRRQRAKDY